MIKIKNVNFKYQGLGQSGLTDINLEIKKGECVLLCGASGCGKTTITRLINGLIPHFFKGDLSGEVVVAGHDITSTPLYDLAGVVGSVFQNPRSQFFSVDTDGEVVFGPENIGLSNDEILRRKEKIVSDMNLENLMDRSLFNLSGGEKQKIACASVAALLPEVIILDEPSSNLDWISIKNLGEIIGKWKAAGKTVIISEHRLWYLKDIIDTVVYLENGMIVNRWSGLEFKEFSNEKLAGLELRPTDVEEKYIDHFMGEIQDSKEPVLENPDISLKDFYFTYTPKKHLFFKKKLQPQDEAICNLRIPHMDIEKGKVVGIIGNNGAGKSTFLRCLCGLEKSCIGRLTIGSDIYNNKDMTKACYMVMQDVNHQLFTDSVKEEVLLSMKEPSEDACDEILQSLDLADFKEKHPMALSGGQKQRVAIASALAAEAKIILLDEPTSGLDYRHMREVSDLIRHLAESGKAVLVSTHDPELVALCCDRIIQINDGRAREVLS